ncbi:succinyl-CoA synthetase subunit beta [Rhodobacterales bacterium HKCCE3408]|nr:succinyl-CoA synthetase subunit beta [Rhodobacterales bacterium HKCCE3408]
MTGPAVAAEPVDRITQAFADHCYSPFLTAETAEARLGGAGARVDFYDLRPFRSTNPVAEPQGRPATPGTDRRCEVAFDGTYPEAGVAAAVAGLEAEGIQAEAPVPEDFPVQPGAEFVAARFLNPDRIAVVQVGTRPGPNGVETFIGVERLTPLSEATR